MPRSLSREERERFLSELHVGVVSVSDGDRGPLTTPVWYTYQEGGNVVFCTHENTRKVRLLCVGTRVSFLVQVEGELTQGILPRYVCVEGPVVKLERADLDRDLRPIFRRYLGQEVGDGYLKATRGEGTTDELVVHIRPDRWFTRDFGA
jgi:uncharacterized protein